MKYKILLLLALTVIFASKCTEEEEIVYFDHVAQAQKDNEALLTYLQTHYVDADGQLDTIDAGQTSVFDDTNIILHTQIVHRKWDYTDDAHDVEIDYKLYYLILNEGVGQQPTKVDSAHISYKGTLLNGTTFDSNSYGLWMTLNSVVKGMSHGMEHLKAGNWSLNQDQSLSFTDVGKGILFMPSGLGYADEYKTNIPSSSPLIFYVSLNMVKRTDWDRDGIYSIYEDLNGNGDFNDDDTDGDGYPNYYDADDDGDGTLTKNEHPDPNGDHNPADALKTLNNIPDYLNSAVK